MLLAGPLDCGCCLQVSDTRFSKGSSSGSEPGEKAALAAVTCDQATPDAENRLLLFMMMSNLAHPLKDHSQGSKLDLDARICQMRASDTTRRICSSMEPSSCNATFGTGGQAAATSHHAGMPRTPLTMRLPGYGDRQCWCSGTGVQCFTVHDHTCWRYQSGLFSCLAPLCVRPLTTVLGVTKASS